MSETSVRLLRRKSAHGRLQSSTSLVPSSAGREGGVAETALEDLVVKKGRSRRVKSARDTKLEQERSDIFPPAEPGAGKGAWGRTQYDDDFGKKHPFTPVPVRPVSPTRRNNPHPAKVQLMSSATRNSALPTLCLRAAFHMHCIISQMSQNNDVGGHSFPPSAISILFSTTSRTKILTNIAVAISHNNS